MLMENEIFMTEHQKELAQKRKAIKERYLVLRSVTKASNHQICKVLATEFGYSDAGAVRFILCQMGVIARQTRVAL